MILLGQKIYLSLKIDERKDKKEVEQPHRSSRLRMNSQIFRKSVPIHLLVDVLETICLKTEKYYLVDKNAYRKLMFNDGLRTHFLTDLKQYYHLSKAFYLDRHLSYNSFTNIVRQLCKSLKIPYNNKIKYIDSKYQIDYYIFYTQQHQNEQEEQKQEH